MSATRLGAVESELASIVDGVAERFVPEAMHGQLIEAEHLSRYWWAASLVSDKLVLDAGCGTAYGSAILAGAGAREVVGVDVAADVLASVRKRMPQSVRLQEADVSSLPFENDLFDVVVCFEVIEHVEDAEATLDELARVLGEGGVLAISSPNRDAYMPGNPHHRHEFVPDEFEETLSRRFTNVRLYRQADWITAAVLEDKLHAFEGDEPLRRAAVRKVVAGELGAELYTLALASNGSLAKPPPTAIMTTAAEIKAVIEASEWLANHSRNVEKERRAFKRRTALAERAEADAQTQATALGSRLLAVETLLARAELTVSRQAADLDDLAHARTEADEFRVALETVQATRLWRVGQRWWRFKRAVLRGD